MNAPHFNSRRRTLMQLAAPGTFGPAGLSALIQGCTGQGDMPAAPGIYDLPARRPSTGKRPRRARWSSPATRLSPPPKSHAVVVIGKDAYLLRAGTNVTFEADPQRSGCSPPWR